MLLEELLFETPVTFGVQAERCEHGKEVGQAQLPVPLREHGREDRRDPSRVEHERRPQSVQREGARGAACDERRG